MSKCRRHFKFTSEKKSPAPVSDLSVCLFTISIITYIETAKHIVGKDNSTRYPKCDRINIFRGHIYNVTSSYCLIEIDVRAVTTIEGTSNKYI